MSDNFEIVEISEQTKPFLEHFRELRRRLITCTIFFLTFFVIFYANSSKLLEYIIKPLLDKPNSPSEIIYTNLVEAFVVYLKIALFGSLILTIPFIVSQIYFFVAPGLYSKEKRLFLPFFAASIILLFTGIFFCYKVIFPNAWDFFLSYQSRIGNLELKFVPRIFEYITICLQFIWVFAIIFQIPVLLLILAFMGLITSNKLRKNRRIFVLFSFIIGAILTPPDIFSQISLALTMILLYEISILIINKIEPKDQQNV